MSASQSGVYNTQQFTDMGAPLVGGRLFTYAFGTTTHKAAFIDHAGAIPHTYTSDGLGGQFIALDARGELPAPLYLTGGSYDLALKTAAGATVWTRRADPVWDITNDLSASSGASLVGYLPAGVGALETTVQGQLLANQANSINVKEAPFYAKCDWNGTTGTDDTAAIQAAADACPRGGSILIPALSKITNEIRITKPMTVRGHSAGSFANDIGGCGVVQVTPTENAFTLVASLANYAFGQFGIVSVHFADMSILGVSGALAVNGVGVDTSINAGDFHIRECTMSNVNIRYFEYGRRMIGIAYLNDVFGGCTSQCTVGDSYERGASSDIGGQNRYFGWTAVLNTSKNASMFEGAVGGGVGFHGCTLSESGIGVAGNQELRLYTSSDCEFESNSVAGIYIPITNNANPASSGTKAISGKFLTNGADIWVDKVSTGFAGGGFHWPMKIDDAYLGSTVGLKVTVPVGHFGIDSDAFIIGENVSGLLASKLDPSQISTNFQGTWQKKKRITKRFTFSAGYVSGTVLGNLPVGMVVSGVRVYLSTQSSVFSALKLGDQSNDSRYILFDAASQAVNTWVNWASPLPQTVIDSIQTRIAIVFSAGANGASGVVEVDGYVP